ncbi:MAG: COP23 domain-containing protein [Crocosphaera sp.]|nr:COP23 domain-containing protein [Crocosphaera sp.]
MKPQNEVKKEMGRLILKPLLIGCMTLIIAACGNNSSNVSNAGGEIDKIVPTPSKQGDVSESQPDTSTQPTVVNDRFYYKEENGAFYTYLKRFDGEDVRFINWDSNYFAPSGYAPEVRAKIVTGRLNQYFNQDDGVQITSGKMNGYEIICVADASSNCKGLLYTLKPYQKGKVAVELLQRQLDAPTAYVPLRESECKTYISIKAVYEGDENNITVEKCR